MLKTKSAVIWSIAQHGCAKVIGLVTTIVLARLLEPAAFGLIAMLAVFVAIGNSLMDSGLSSSLIRSRLVGQKDLSTVFIFNLVGSFTAYLALFLSAPLIADFYQQPVLGNVVRVYGLSFVINAFFSIQSVLLTKQMRFKVQTLIQLPASIFGGCVGVFLAIKGFGVWSLVWMNLAATTLSAVMHWYFSVWRPRLIFSKKSFRKHFAFGFKLTLSGLIETVYQNLYTIVIGRYYAATQLGFYARADALSQLPIGIFTTAVNKVVYPMFSSISNNNVQLKAVYQKLIRQVLFWNAPCLVFLAVAAQPLIGLLLTDKWLPAVPYFQLLCLAGIFYPLHAYNLNILKVKGQSAQFLKLEIIKKTISALGIVCCLPFGMMALLYFHLFFSVFGYYINSLYSNRLIGYPIKEQIEDNWTILALAIIIGLLALALDSLLVGYRIGQLARVLILGLAYTMCYLGINQLLKTDPLEDFKLIISKK